MCVCVRLVSTCGCKLNLRTYRTPFPFPKSPILQRHARSWEPLARQTGRKTHAQREKMSDSGPISWPSFFSFFFHSFPWFPLALACKSVEVNPRRPHRVAENQKKSRRPYRCTSCARIPGGISLPIVLCALWFWKDSVFFFCPFPLSCSDMLRIEPRLLSQRRNHLLERLIRAAHVGRGVLEPCQQRVRLGALPPHLVDQQRVLTLRRRELRAQLCVVPRQRRVQMRGENGLRRECVRSCFRSLMLAKVDGSFVFS